VFQIAGQSVTEDDAAGGVAERRVSEINTVVAKEAAHPYPNVSSSNPRSPGRRTHRHHGGS
jgi:hypothetical protein